MTHATDGTGFATASTGETGDTIRHLLSRCTFPPAVAPVRCALSGGPDSSALVALAVSAGLDVEAVHVHHGLRPSADDDATTAARIAARLDVPCRVVHVEVGAGPNLEARARDARRRAIGPDALWGHTLDDQAETVLLALLRGAGATGLAAMRPGPHRPLLGLRRSDTRAVCALFGLEPAHDPTNDDRRFRRNRLRHEVIPLLDEVAERDVAPLLARAADLVRDDDDLLDTLSLDLDPTDARALAAAPPPLARRAVRRWLAVDGYPPDAAAVDRVLAVARGEHTACEVAGVGRVECRHGRLRHFAG